jgi:hypothetical protein
MAISTLVFSKYGDNEPFLLHKIWFGQVSRYSPFTVPTCDTGATIILGLSVHWTRLQGHKYLFLANYHQILTFKKPYYQYKGEKRGFFTENRLKATPNWFFFRGGCRHIYVSWLQF